MTTSAVPASEVPTISRAELAAALRARRVTLLDVLPFESFALAHLPGAISLPVAEIGRRAADVLPDRHAAIVAYCGGPTCPLGAQAVALLNELGYTDVRHYPGGLEEWMQSDQIVPIARRRAAGAPGFSGTVARTSPHARLASASARFVDALGDQTVGALFRLWTAIVGGCAVAYWCLAWLPGHAVQGNGTVIHPDALGALSALYFSAVTATSVGYGDLVPLGAARLVAIAESAAGLLIFGVLISKFVSRRQEALIGEIHRIAFEDRLGRVRTNLHLVRTEVQATARLCEGHDMPPPVAVARIESIAMVFVGELRVVHDLLYRPQETPDEPALEAILAGLASVFREFSELLRCVADTRAGHPPSLRTSIATMSQLAADICGDCVPRQHAPLLRTWMDQIQRLAREIALPS